MLEGDARAHIHTHTHTDSGSLAGTPPASAFRAPCVIAERRSCREIFLRRRRSPTLSRQRVEFRRQRRVNGVRRGQRRPLVMQQHTAGEEWLPVRVTPPRLADRVFVGENSIETWTPERRTAKTCRSSRNNSSRNNIVPASSRVEVSGMTKRRLRRASRSSICSWSRMSSTDLLDRRCRVSRAWKWCTSEDLRSSRNQFRGHSCAVTALWLGQMIKSLVLKAKSADTCRNLRFHWLRRISNFTRSNPRSFCCCRPMW